MFAGFEILFILLAILLYQKYSDAIRQGMLSLKGRNSGKAMQVDPAISQEMIQAALTK